MGVDTKMFIATKTVNILEIMPKVIDAINEWQRKDLVRYADSKGFNSTAAFLFRDKENELNKNLKDYSNGIRHCTTNNFGSFNISFTIKGENRNLFITHTCSSDYKETYDGEKIIFSLGYWGMSEEIMLVIANTIKDFGDVYYTHNDCSNDFEKLKLN